MSSDAAFQGDFSFVNVDASSLSTLPHRQQVTRHVHGYRRWKKGQDARRLRESSGFHGAAELNPRSQRPTPRPTVREDRPPLPLPAPALSTPIQNLPPLIDVILLNSNSGPSGALPVQLTATINSLLSFERDCIFPSIKALELRMTEKKNASRKADFTTTWINDSHAYLYDSLAIHSYLARIAATRYIVTSEPQFLDVAHEFRRKGVGSLKEYMTTTTQFDIPRLYRALLILLWTDSVLVDKEAFQHHAAVLKDIFQSHHDALSADPSFHVHHFLSIVYFEVQYAVMTLSKTSMDLRPDEWVEKQFTPIWDQVSPGFPFSRPSASQELDPHLQGDVRNLFMDVQETLEVIKLMRMNSVWNTSLTWMHAISKTMLAIGRLVNLYAGLENPLLDMEDSNGILSAVQRLETAAACLCAVYWIRELAGIENINMAGNMTLFAWNSIMLTSLDRLLRAYSGIASNPVEQVDNIGSARLLLWLLWTGAMAEHSIISAEASVEGRKWFTERFRDQCRSINVASLLQCQGILDRFLQLYGMRPGSGDEWYIRCFPRVEARAARQP